jgi:hypothetical protein
MYANLKANINSKMVTNADKGPEILRDEEIANREIVLETASLYSITGDNQQNLEYKISEAESKTLNFRWTIIS